ncbi:uncharacterized protein LAJ45_06849 [Morchella importuna]|uniref:uncharacterized protein n=1 Tax=Morchella importuna TaxID=1174673 RepID=UPI001E8ED0B4|nr:uncharacterized protein LAJ45_06849 [Morchella importuna]KAH8149309.1 hypothetical protein LAJ45_06849 [Morchella importuna]
MWRLVSKTKDKEGKKDVHFCTYTRRESNSIVPASKSKSMDISSSTSKVTVTYWDPFSLYPLISSDLRSRLPLRNLHWKAPARPLRSINSLHVELNPSPSSPAFGSSHDLTRVKSSESSRSVDSTVRSASKPSAPQKERRHQIPGLRNTPYLKIFLLRCDDNDTYKNTSRKLLREWVSEHTASSSNENKQHDAFEWLIIHVVLPNTSAALQPRSSSSASNAAGSSRWMKGSTTLLDKIRGDFNSNTSKKDRIVQIRISPTHPALATLSPPVLVGNQIVPVPETPTESEMAWLDLIAKFKTQILASFDARVSQYEDDIREKDSQRRLPGWNFCTFFVLKEGLARAFESVGLVEDALVLYDELGFGLDAIARDQEQKEKAESSPDDVVGGKFVGWTKESIWWIEKARNRWAARRGGKDDEEQEDVDEGNPLGTERKHYRELILSNEISLFDFKCYLFARQSTLLLRLGKGHNIGLDIGSPGTASGTFSLHEAAAAAVGKPEEDLTRLAEVCKRGLEFVTSVARALRADLWTAYHSSSEEKPDENEDNVSWMVDNIVSSWIFAVCEQLLNQTATSILAEGSLASPTDSVSGKFPRRTSSLPPTPSSEITSFGQTHQGSISGLEDLAAVRADLMLLARGVVETFGKRKGWIGSLGWFFLPEVERGEVEPKMEEVRLDDDRDTPQTKTASEKNIIDFWGVEGIRNATLRRVIEGDRKEEFYKIFEDLSEKAMTNFGLAKRVKSCERVEADLAALRFHLKDYARAASHLEKMTKFYADQGWGLIETTLLGIRKEKSGSLDSHVLEEEAAVIGYIDSIVELSKDNSKEISAPMSNFWSDITVDPYPRHMIDRDGFEVVVKMRYLLKEEMRVEKIRVRIVNTVGQVKEVWMETEEPTIMKKGIVRALVRTNATVPGTYMADRIIVTANKLTFLHELTPKSSPVTPAGLPANSGVAVTTAKKLKLSFFPAPRNLLVRLEVPKEINLDHPKATEIVLNPGENLVLKGELRVRSATAGLRLMTADLKVLEGEGMVDTNEKPGVILFSNMGKGQKIRLRVPYTSENDLTELSVKVEIDYTTVTGDFFFADKLSIAVILPLAVNVQDVFKPGSLFSKFQVSTANPEMPLRILKATLEGSDSFEAKSGQGTEGSMVVFAKQPASFTYKITRKGPKESQKEQPLALIIKYRTIDEEIIQSVRSTFASQLQAAGKEKYMHWLQPILISQLQKRHLLELETTALLGEVRLGTYEEYGWEEALDGITPTHGEREQMEHWLKEFYKKNAIIQLNSAFEDPDTEPITRLVVIPVEVPQLQVIHTVEINILSDANSKSLSTPYTPQMVAVGQAIPAELVIRHSRAWNAVYAKDEEIDVGDEELEFFYEVQNNLEVWLVSGRKRSHFTAKEGQIHRFPILLVPLKAGNLLLPNVEVKQYIPVQQQSETTGIISSETDYRSNGECVLVLPDVRSTTVKIDSSFGGEEGFRSPASIRA